VRKHYRDSDRIPVVYITTQTAKRDTGHLILSSARRVVPIDGRERRSENEDRSTMTSQIHTAQLVPTGAELVGRAVALQPLLRAHASQGEIDRRQADEVIAGLTEAGLFRLLKPNRFGGYLTDVRTVLGVTEALGLAALDDSGTQAHHVEQLDTGCDLERLGGRGAKLRHQWAIDRLCGGTAVLRGVGQFQHRRAQKSVQDRDLRRVRGTSRLT
jgi:hypothetical protein